MAERKRVKGKKPTESMRQRQQRLLREQRAAKAKARTVKTNPTGAPRGAQGPRTAPVQGPSRRTPSTIVSPNLCVERCRLIAALYFS